MGCTIQLLTSDKQHVNLKLCCWACEEEKMNLSYPHNKGKRKPNYYNPDLITQANRSPFRNIEKPVKPLQPVLRKLWPCSRPLSSPIQVPSDQKPRELLWLDPPLEAISFTASLCFILPRNITVRATYVPAEWAARAAACKASGTPRPPHLTGYSHREQLCWGAHCRQPGAWPRACGSLRVMSNVLGEGAKAALPSSAFFSLKLVLAAPVPALFSAPRNVSCRLKHWVEFLLQSRQKNYENGSSRVYNQKNNKNPS